MKFYLPLLSRHHRERSGRPVFENSHLSTSISFPRSPSAGCGVSSVPVGLILVTRNWRREKNNYPSTLHGGGFPHSLVRKESACNAGDPGSIPGSRRPLGEGKGEPLQRFGLENPMDCIVLGVAKNQTRLSDFHFTHTLWQVLGWDSFFSKMPHKWLRILYCDHYNSRLFWVRLACLFSLKTTVGSQLSLSRTQLISPPGPISRQDPVRPQTRSGS